MSLLSPASLEQLKGRKNLLAFSAGVDSSALFFLLLEAQIDFDIALVNYRTRTDSDKEAAHAEALASKYGKACYIKEISLPRTNFEHEARKVRYAFFEEIIHKQGYDNLLTAHHLGDRLEWFLMQLTKGAGLVEMLGFEETEPREGYTIVRPLIGCDKTDLKSWLDAHGLPYFEDVSNIDESIKRNRFRKRFATPLLKAYRSGIAKSFAYLEKDKKALFTLDIVERYRSFYLLRKHHDQTRNLRQIDRVLKQEGYLISAAQREEIMRQGVSVIAGRFVVALTAEKIYIAPYLRRPMPKPFKEACRKAGIPAKIRPYLFASGYPLKASKPPAASGPAAL